MKRRKRHNDLMSNMNVVPYIDVMLVLLIIFMVTAPMFVPGVINLPSVGKASQVTKQPVEINIDKLGRYSLVNNHQTTTIIGIDNLVAATRQFINTDTTIVIAADKEVQYNDVIKVVDQLYALGIKKIALVVKERNG